MKDIVYIKFGGVRVNYSVPFFPVLSCMGFRVIQYV